MSTNEIIDIIGLVICALIMPPLIILCWLMVIYGIKETLRDDFKIDKTKDTEQPKKRRD